jgi:zeta-carotene desaturase
MTKWRDEILEIALRELKEIFPRAKQATLLKAVVVKEAKATLSPQPGFDSIRPGPTTPFGNLFLAGDWTAMGWPPTMEGAVRSGYRAAELVTQAAGHPQTFLQPDLPTDPLVRVLQRLWT